MLESGALRTNDFEGDVVAELPTGDDLPPRAYHDLVPDWPDWVRARSTFGGGRLAVFSYMSRVNGHDHVVSPGVDWNGTDPPRLAPHIDLDRLRRLDDDQEYAWAWTRLATLERAEAFAAGRMAEALADARRRLPEILASLPSAPDPE